MFNRGNSTAAAEPLSVEIELSDGRELSGTLLVPIGRPLTEVLNGASSFVEFQPLSGERMYIAKSALQSVRPTNVPGRPDLWAGPTQGDNFDPFAILGLKPGSTQEEARTAYLNLAKIYHPDRYATAELPAEVREYLSVMVRRINAAHDALKVAQHRQSAKQEPVFTKAGNA